MLLGGESSERVEDVGVVRGTLLDRPVLHGESHRVGDAGVDRLALFDGRLECLVDALGQPVLHDRVAEDVRAEDLARGGLAEVPRLAVGLVAVDGGDGAGAGTGHGRVLLPGRGGIGNDNRRRLTGRRAHRGSTANVPVAARRRVQRRAVEQTAKGSLSGGESQFKHPRAAFVRRHGGQRDAVARGPGLDGAGARATARRATSIAASNAGSPAGRAITPSIGRAAACTARSGSTPTRL